MEAPEGGYRTYDELAEGKLGKVNGNIFQLRPAEVGGHDGVIMIRLKKKRFIVIDYSLGQYDPNCNVNASSSTNTAHNRTGVAGSFSLSLWHSHQQHIQHKSTCTNFRCTKVGVPNLVYDSEPVEPTSLYLRSGLCFTCQRSDNEKRRTQRKRKSDWNTPANSTSIKRHNNSNAGINSMYDLNLNSPFGGASSTRGDATAAGSANALMLSIMSDYTTAPYHQHMNNIDMNLPSISNTASMTNRADVAAAAMNYMNLPRSASASATSSTSSSTMLNATLEHARMVIDEARQNVTILMTASLSASFQRRSVNDEDNIAAAVPIVMTTGNFNTAATKVDVAMVYQKTIAGLKNGVALLQQCKANCLDGGAASSNAETQNCSIR